MQADATVADGTTEVRPRVLVSVTYGFSVRYLLSTEVLDRLAAEVEVVVGLGWDDGDLVAELRRRGLPSIRLPDARLDHAYRRLRRQLDLVHQHRLRSPTTAIERRQRDALVTDRRARTLGRLRRTRDAVAVRMPGAAERIEASEPEALEHGTNLDEFRKVLDAVGVDLVVSVTPYHEQDTLLLVAAASSGVPSVTSVISFDNPTTRRRFPIVSERVLVWNRHNRDELLRSYPGLDERRIVITGAPQFDLHHRPELVLDEARWRERMGLPADRPVILYGGGPSFLVPEEPRLARLLDEAIEGGAIAGQPVLLVRRHPADDPGPWRALAGELRHGVVAEPWDPGTDPNRGWPTTADLELQMSSLAHSVVHVNVCSSMTLDGAVFDRPQIGPTFVPGVDRTSAREVRDLYLREHWWPVTASGALVTAGSPSELVDAIDAALRDPSRGRDGRRRLVEDLLTFDDGQASGRLVAEIVAATGRGSDRGSGVAGGVRS